jgi:hypothetical protein
MGLKRLAPSAGALLAALCACGELQNAAHSNGTLVVGRVQRPIIGGRDDNFAWDRDITVALKRPGSAAVACSGVLLTPTVVATASACLAQNRAGSIPEVYFGSDLATAVKLPVVSAEAMPPSSNGAPGPVALLFLETAANSVYEFAGMSYQTFSLPDWAGTPYEVAGWSPAGADGQPRPGTATIRQVALLADSGFSLQPSTQATGEYRWVRSALRSEAVEEGFDNARLEGADLGGPLMYYTNNMIRMRQVLGILTHIGASSDQLEGCASAPCDGWVALGPVNDGMDTPAVAWIKSKLATNPSPRWEAAHWREPVHGEAEASWWRGEVDYYGPCYADRDSDCDHWFDFNSALGCSGAPQQGCQRDNCLHWPNMDQLDTNDDMSGDSCASPLPVQSATYDPTYKAPACLTTGSGCSSRDLLVGRAKLGPEPNASNALGGSCADGPSGSFHWDESIDRITVSTLTGAPLSPGAVVAVSVDVWAYTSYASDHLDLFVASDARNPSWDYVRTLSPSAAGANTLSTTLLLESGEIQAIRAVFRYGGDSKACPDGSYDDVDDLVFATNFKACPPGYAWDGTTCADVCQSPTGNGGCSPLATCSQYRRGRICWCDPGFQGDGLTCEDVDECLTDNGGCSPNADCRNTFGSRTCTCKTGFTGNGIDCININECLTNNGGCSPYATCTDTIGSRTCQCGPMYQGDGLTCTRKPLIVEGPYDWQQGQARVDLGGRIGDRICWLSRMTGLFMSGDERVSTSLVQHPINDGNGDAVSWDWFLEGNSTQRDVAASAMCTNSKARYWGSVNWKQGQSPTYIGPADGRVCFLTSVTGRFEGWGEYVQTYISNGAWYLGGASQQSGVAATAVCYKDLNFSDEYTWRQGQPAFQIGSPGQACALTFVGGKFKGASEMVNITRNGGNLYLGGASQQTDVQARARCFW